MGQKQFLAPSSLKDSFLLTSESVSEGHPDKVCDRISDALVDMYLCDNPDARCAIEVMATTNRVVIAGESNDPEAYADMIDKAVRDEIKEIGYDQPGFHWRNIEIHNYLHQQSADIAIGVDEREGKEEGAGDQGIMFGYACRETETLMPAPVYYAHNILKNIADARHNGGEHRLLPDAKCQVSLLYQNEKPIKAHSVLISSQHIESISQDDVREIVRPYVVAALPDGWFDDDTDFLVNPTGKFVIGGPDGDAGLTGRKIIVDTYGGAAPHGGGAFSGKDPTKVDRSAAYILRYLAKNVVAAGLAERCTLQLSYAIGMSEPLSFYANLHDTGKVSENVITEKLASLVDLRPKAIRERLGLSRPIYTPTSSYGHFGRTPTAEGHFSWEKIELDL